MIGIDTAISGLNKAYDLIKAINNFGKTVEINKITVELQQIILTAHQTINTLNAEKSAMVEEINALKKEIISMETWEREKERYELKNVGVGAFAYVIKKAMEGTEPIHWICANCFQNGRKAILQEVRNNGICCKCFTCNTTIQASFPHI